MANIFRWAFDAARRIYVRLTGGRPLTIGRDKLVGRRDGITRAGSDIAARLTDQLMNGDISLPRWILDFRQELKQKYIAQYLLGRGGLENMTQADWGSLGGQLKRQYEYMQRFAQDVANGRLSPAQVRARMQLYFESSTQAYERGSARAAGLPELPQYPGDGRTQCRTNCKCEWQIVETELEWECYWKLNPAEHCVDCLNNAARWNPLRITRLRERLREILG